MDLSNLGILGRARVPVIRPLATLKLETSPYNPLVVREPLTPDALKRLSEEQGTLHLYGRMH